MPQSQNKIHSHQNNEVTSGEALSGTAFKMTAVVLPLLILFSHWLCRQKKIPVLDYLFRLSKCPKKSQACFLFCFRMVLIYIFYAQVGLKLANLSPYLDLLGADWAFLGFDGWEWSHVILYFIYSFICPNDWIFVFVVGLTFEILELLVGKLTRNDEYWTSNSKYLLAWDDIKANLVGYAAGHLVQWLMANRLKR